jgi:hypothetical protein
MAVNDTDWLVLRIQHGERVEVGLGSEDIQHLGDGCVLVDRWLLVEQGAEVMIVFAETGLVAHHLRQQLARIAWRFFLRAC